MTYENFTTFRVRIKNAVAWVTFDEPPVNIQGLPMIADAGALKPLLDETSFGLRDVSKAHDRLTSGQAIGKVVVEI